MDNVAARACPVCASSSITFLHEVRLELPVDSPLPRSYRIVGCQSCGMVYADSSATQADYDRYYEQFSKYEDPKVASGGGHSAPDRARLDEMATVLARQLSKSDRIVDIGCANGGLLDALAGLGFSQLTGIDPSPVCVSHIVQKGYHGYSQKLSELNPEVVGTYQAVILSHVMEHVFDVSSAMEAVSSLLTENGLLYIEVPDASRYQSHYVVPFYYFDAEHINHFDAHALENLARRHGYVPVEGGNKHISVSSAVHYPATYGIFRKAATEVLQKPLITNDLQISIKGYIEQSKADDRLSKIDGYAASGEPVILWGAGSYTSRLLLNTKLGDCNIVAIVDNDQNKQGRSIRSMHIQSPDSLRGIAGTILISAAIYADEIRQDIIALGLSNTVDVLG